MGTGQPDYLEISTTKIRVRGILSLTRIFFINLLQQY